MSPLRLAALLASSSFISACLMYLVFSSNDEYGVMRHGYDSLTGHFYPFFSFSAPSSLFTPAATISLTDENSTFFAARSAAFGPTLPDIGLSGQLWIGSGFRTDRLESEHLSATAEGELGCGDLPDWHQEEDVSKIAQLEHETQQISGRVVLLSRGACGFADKVRWAQRRNASAVIVGDNVAGEPLVRMWAKDTTNITIPSVFTSHTSAHVLSAFVPQLVDGGAGPQIPGNPPKRLLGGEHSSRTQAGEPSKVVVPGSGELASLLPGGSPDYSPIPGSPAAHEGLWVTLSVSSMAISPFFNTLFVLVVSPLLTLGIVYAMLFFRSRIRRRRWRAPKSVVDQLPVRIYRATSSRPSPVSSPTSDAVATTPLLQVTASDTELHGARDASSNSVSDPRPVTYGATTTPGPGKTATSSLGGVRRYQGRQVECAVCLEEYEEGVSKVMSLPCGHDFHVDCITPWLVTKRRTCPICKGDVVRSVGEAEDPEASETSLLSQSAPATAGPFSRRTSPILAPTIITPPRPIMNNLERHNNTHASPQSG